MRFWLIFCLFNVSHIMQIKKIIYSILFPVALAACTGPKTTTTPSAPPKEKTITKKMVNGYQLQVLNTTDRTEALNAKSLLLTKYPQQKTFLMYQSPYYKVRFGNFLTQNEAVSYQKKIKAHYANVFVIPTRFEIRVKE
jgi:Flp pilus assembly protein TadG